MSLNVTDVSLDPVDAGDDRLLAFASVVLEEEFVVHNIRLIWADSGLLMAMPSEQYNGSFRDVAHPLTNACRRRIRKALLDTYSREEGSWVDRSPPVGSDETEPVDPEMN